MRRALSIFLLLVLWPKGAHMSGEASVSYLSEWYGLTYGSGVRVAIAPEPRPDGRFVDRSGEYFAREGSRMRHALEPHVHAVTAVVDAYRRAGKLPLLPMGTPAISLQRAVIGYEEDDMHSGYEARLRRWFAKKPRPGLVVEGEESVGDSFAEVTLDLILSAPIHAEVLDALMEEVADAMEAKAERPGVSPLVEAATVTTPIQWGRVRFSLAGEYWEERARSALSARSEAQAAAYLKVVEKVLAKSTKSGVALAKPNAPGAVSFAVEQSFCDGSVRVELWAGSEALGRRAAEQINALLHKALGKLEEERYSGLP